jgi:O-acetyl-ADP-ribose deacetylase (regulator of RNase III)
MILETFHDGRVVLKVGDITDETVDAVVNAANSTLLGGGGVDGAIHSRGGSAILEECKKIRTADYPSGLPTGKAVITTAGNLPAKYVIHTVGPVYGMNDGRDAEPLADSYTNSLRLAAANSLASIAFPSISTGAFYYPKHEAAAVVSDAIKKFLENDSSIKQVRLVFFSESDANVFGKHHRF